MGLQIVRQRPDPVNCPSPHTMTAGPDEIPLLFLDPLVMIGAIDRFNHSRPAAQYFSIGREGVSGAHHKQIANDDLIDVDASDPALTYDRSQRPDQFHQLFQLSRCVYLLADTDANVQDQDAEG